MGKKKKTFREWLNGELNGEGRRLSLSEFARKTEIPYPTCSTYSRGLTPGPLNAGKIKAIYPDCPIAV